MARLACRTGAVCPGPRPHTESGEQARAHGERRGDGDQARAGAVCQAEGARRGGSYSHQYAAVPLIRASRVRATSLLTLRGVCAQAPWKHPSGSLGMCPSAGSIGGAHLENQDQAVSVLEWRSSSRRSGFAAAEQRIEHEAGPRHARRLSKLQISR